jgi:hypothetical protein
VNRTYSDGAEPYMPSIAHMVLALAIAGFVLISAIVTGSFPLGIAGSVNARQRPKTFWGLLVLVCGFVLLLGFVA